MKRTFRIIAALTLALVASLSLAAVAPAKARDRNHDRLPDRWEKRHKLSLKVKQARRDQDEDGLSNLGEYRAGLHPRDPDSDDDGIEDGDENAGRVVSFEGDVLTISLADGGTLSARVGEGTRVKCKYAGDEPLAEKSSMPGEGSDEPPVWKNPDAPVEPLDEEEGDDDDQGEDQPEGEEPKAEPEHRECTLDDLVKGAKVSEAQLELHRGKLYWTKLELR